VRSAQPAGKNLGWHRVGHFSGFVGPPFLTVFSGNLDWWSLVESCDYLMSGCGKSYNGWEGHL